jgi:hypothetical protein
MRPFGTTGATSLALISTSSCETISKKRGLASPLGVRARIEKIVPQLPAGHVLETNICSQPTKTALELRPRDRATDIFRFLLQTIRPRLVYAHSDEPIRYFERLTGSAVLLAGEPQLVACEDHQFELVVTRGPLFRMGFQEAECMGRRIAHWIKDGDT